MVALSVQRGDSAYRVCDARVGVASEHRLPRAGGIVESGLKSIVGSQRAYTCVPPLPLPLRAGSRRPTAYRLAPAVDVEAMASFMGRAGSGTGVASRALDPLRSRLRPAGSQRTYLSISHLRSLHIELVALLYSAGATSATPTPSSSAEAPNISAKQNRRLVEILRSIAELVRERTPPHFFLNTGCSVCARRVNRVCVLHALGTLGAVGAYRDLLC